MDPGFYEQLFLAVVSGVLAAGGSGYAVISGLATAEHRRDTRKSMLTTAKGAAESCKQPTLFYLARSRSVPLAGSRVSGHDICCEAQRSAVARGLADLEALLDQARQSNRKDARFVRRRLRRVKREIRSGVMHPTGTLNLRLAHVSVIRFLERRLAASVGLFRIWSFVSASWELRRLRQQVLSSATHEKRLLDTRLAELSRLLDDKAAEIAEAEGHNFGTSSGAENREREEWLKTIPERATILVATDTADWIDHCDFAVRRTELAAFIEAKTRLALDEL